MTLHVKYAMMTAGSPTDRDFEVETQEEAEALIEKDLATGVDLVHGHVVDKDTHTTIAKLVSGETAFRSVPGTTGWEDRS
jgi:hypothetical protein